MPAVEGTQCPEFLTTHVRSGVFLSPEPRSVPPGVLLAQPVPGQHLVHIAPHAAPEVAATALLAQPPDVIKRAVHAPSASVLAELDLPKAIDLANSLHLPVRVPGDALARTDNKAVWLFDAEARRTNAPDPAGYVLVMPELHLIALHASDVNTSEADLALALGTGHHSYTGPEIASDFATTITFDGRRPETASAVEVLVYHLSHPLIVVAESTKVYVGAKGRLYRTEALARQSGVPQPQSEYIMAPEVVAGVQTQLRGDRDWSSGAVEAALHRMETALAAQQSEAGAPSPHLSLTDLFPRDEGFVVYGFGPISRISRQPTDNERGTRSYAHIQIEPDRLHLFLQSANSHIWPGSSKRHLSDGLTLGGKLAVRYFAWREFVDKKLPPGQQGRSSAWHERATRLLSLSRKEENEIFISLQNGGTPRLLSGYAALLYSNAAGLMHAIAAGGLAKDHIAVAAIVAMPQLLAHLPNDVRRYLVDDYTFIVETFTGSAQQAIEEMNPKAEHVDRLRSILQARDVPVNLATLAHQPYHLEGETPEQEQHSYTVLDYLNQGLRPSPRPTITQQRSLNVSGFFLKDATTRLPLIALEVRSYGERAIGASKALSNYALLKEIKNSAYRNEIAELRGTPAEANGRATARNALSRLLEQSEQTPTLWAANQRSVEAIEEAGVHVLGATRLNAQWRQLDALAKSHNRPVIGIAPDNISDDIWTFSTPVDRLEALLDGRTLPDRAVVVVLGHDDTIEALVHQTGRPLIHALTPTLQSGFTFDPATGWHNEAGWTLVLPEFSATLDNGASMAPRSSSAIPLGNWLDKSTLAQAFAYADSPQMLGWLWHDFLHGRRRPGWERQPLDRLWLWGSDPFGLRDLPPQPEFLKQQPFDGVPTEGLVDLFRRLDLTKASEPVDLAELSYDQETVWRAADVLWMGPEAVKTEQQGSILAQAEMPKIVHSFWYGSNLNRWRRNKYDFVEHITASAIAATADKFMFVLWTTTTRAEFRSPTASVRRMKEWAAEFGIILVNVHEVFNTTTPMRLMPEFQLALSKGTTTGYAEAKDISLPEVLYRFGGIGIDADNEVKSVKDLYGTFTRYGFALDVEAAAGGGMNTSSVMFARSHPAAHRLIEILGNNYRKDLFGLTLQNESLHPLLFERQDVHARYYLDDLSDMHTRSIMERSGATNHDALIDAIGHTVRSVPQIPSANVESRFSMTWLPERSPEVYDLNLEFVGPWRTPVVLPALRQAVTYLIRELANRRGNLHLLAVEPLLKKLPNPDAAWEAVVGFLLALPGFRERIRTVTYSRLINSNNQEHTVHLPRTVELALNIDSTHAVLNRTAFALPVRIPQPWVTVDFAERQIDLPVTPSELATAAEAIKDDLRRGLQVDVFVEGGANGTGSIFGFGGAGARQNGSSRAIAVSRRLQDLLGGVKGSLLLHPPITRGADYTTIRPATVTSHRQAVVRWISRLAPAIDPVKIEMTVEPPGGPLSAPMLAALRDLAYRVVDSSAHGSLELVATGNDRRDVRRVLIQLMTDVIANLALQKRVDDVVVTEAAPNPGQPLADNTVLISTRLLEIEPLTISDRKLVESVNDILRKSNLPQAPAAIVKASRSLTSLSLGSLAQSAVSTLHAKAIADRFLALPKSGGAGSRVETSTPVGGADHAVAPAAVQSSTSITKAAWAPSLSLNLPDGAIGQVTAPEAPTQQGVEDGPLTNDMGLPPGSLAENEDKRLYWTGPKPGPATADQVRSITGKDGDPVIFLGGERGKPASGEDISDLRRLVQLFSLNKQRIVVVTETRVDAPLARLSEEFGFSIVPRVLTGLDSGWEIRLSNGSTIDEKPIAALTEELLETAIRHAARSKDRTSPAVALLLLKSDRAAKMTALTNLRAQLSAPQALRELIAIVDKNEGDRYFRGYIPLVGELGALPSTAEYVFDYQEKLEAPARKKLLLDGQSRGVSIHQRVLLISESGDPVTGAKIVMEAIHILETEGLEKAVEHLKDRPTVAEKQEWGDALGELARNNVDKAEQYYRLATAIFDCSPVTGGPAGGA
ncbi:hypothetical protein [Micromonospora sp. NPDC049102]|uniref:hypothetical protein n=1 Tax=Micromonospora sp. NPDC049102 TaxID=3364265 RepID=UPI003716AD0A